MTSIPKTFGSLLLALALALGAAAQTATNKSPAQKSDPFINGPKPLSAALPASGASEPQAPNAIPRLQCDVAFVAFPLDIVEKWARASTTATPSSDSIIKGWTEGKGRLLASSKATVQNGSNYEMKSVTEHIYPTDFEPINAIGSSGNTNTATQAPVAIIPTAFQTRDCGWFVNITPTLDPDGKSVTLVMSPQYVEFFDESEHRIDVTGSITNVTESLVARQPIFHNQLTLVNTFVTLGETSVFGGTTSANGKDVVFVFVTISLKR